MSRNNRKVIEKKCAELGLKIKSLVFERRQEASLGDTWMYSCWMLELENGESYETNDDLADDAVDSMLEEVEFDVKEKEEK